MKVVENGSKLAVVLNEQSEYITKYNILDIAMNIKYSTKSDYLLIPKHLICEEFFDLSTKVAGDILQKMVNYHVNVAIFGDFSMYTSKSLKDFIYETNQGRQFNFSKNEDEALEWAFRNNDGH